MSDNVSLGSASTQNYIAQSGNTEKTATTNAAIIDNEWTDDSISSLFNTQSKDGKTILFNNLPNAPKLPVPDHALAEAATFGEVKLPNKNDSIKSKQGDDSSGKYPSDELLNKTYDAFFEKIIQGKPNEAELRFAHYNNLPGAPKSPEEQQALSEVLLQFNLTSQEFNPVPNKATFMEKANLTYADEFESSLENQKPPLTDEQKAKIKFMHFNPNAAFPGSDDLKEPLEKIEKEAQANAAQKSGISLKPDGTPSVALSINSNMYTAGLNGFYQENVSKLTDKFLASNPLKQDGTQWTAQDKIGLQKALAEKDAAVPDFVAKAAASIKAEALSKLNTDFNLTGVGFVPAPVGTYPPVNPMTFGGIKEAEAILQQGLAVAAGIPQGGPNGPLKAILLDILREISHALTKFKTSLYEGQGVTSEQAQAWSKAKMDINLNQIKENINKAKEASKQQDKIASMGVFGKIFKFIIMLVLFIISAITLNPVGMAVAMMSMIDAVNPELQVFVKVMKAIDNMVAKLMPYLSKEQLKGAQIFAKFMFIQAAGPLMILSCPELLTESHIIRDIAMATGKSKEEAESIEQMSIMIATIVVTVVIAIVGTILTLGMAGLALFPGLAAQVPRLASAAATLGNLGTQFGGKGAQIAQAIATLANDLASLTQSALQIGQSEIKQDLSMLLAKMKAHKVESDADIANIQKLIKKLLATLAADAAAINFVASVQSHVLSGMSQSSSSIANLSA